VDLNDPGNQIHRFFAGLSEHIFETELGVADPPLIDYVADLLFRFVRAESMVRIRTLTGRPVTEVAEMMGEADHRIGLARREVHRHIGDFTLFWTGVYPEALREMQRSDRKDQFVDYCHQGKRAYHIASTIPTDDEQSVPGSVLLDLSEHFEMCAYGLREIRREWERRDDDPDRPHVLLIG
jgi:hypothetical protein